MSIIIKGLDMPKHCMDCILCYREPEYFGCEALKRVLAHVGDGFYKMQIPEDCPLVELPPHGRLIDVDKLIESAGAYRKENIRMDTLADEWYVRLRDIESAPTIIEAEEGEE